jgi:hypothetical protein
MNKEIEAYIEDPNNVYPESFYSNRRRMNKWEFLFGIGLVEVLNINSLVDFGCGLGVFLDGALSTGKIQNLVGYEYCYDNAKKYLSQTIKPYIYYGNVMESINCGKFDCVLSFEVAEHILTEKSDIFVKNLTESSNKYIVLTAAPPGQGGTGHINEQPKDFWIDKIESVGFSMDSKTASLLMGYAKMNRIGLPKYIKRNFMVFQKKG